MDLWFEIEQERERNADHIAFLEKKIADDAGEDMPSLFGPKAVSNIYTHHDLEVLMHQYETYFQRPIDTMDLKLDLLGWRILLKYCLKNNKPLKKISNQDIHRIQHPPNMCLEEDEIYNCGIPQQKSLLLRKSIRFAKHIQASLTPKGALKPNQTTDKKDV